MRSGGSAVLSTGRHDHPTREEQTDAEDRPQYLARHGIRRGRRGLHEHLPALAGHPRDPLRRGRSAGGGPGDDGRVRARRPALRRDQRGPRTSASTRRCPWRSAAAPRRRSTSTGSVSPPTAASPARAAGSRTATASRGRSPRGDRRACSRTPTGRRSTGVMPGILRWGSSTSRSSSEPRRVERSGESRWLSPEIAQARFRRQCAYCFCMRSV